MQQVSNAIDTLRKFAHQKPGLEFCNYGDVRIYRREMNEITKDLHDFRELLSYAIQRVNNLDDKIKAYLERSSGRLTIDEKGHLQYITGQYFPTEYRPAAARVLADIIWADYRDEKRADGTNVYETGHDIRKALSKWLSRRIMKYYFN
jgi:transcription termination factor NusB